MKVIESDRITFFDCDDTLIMWKCVNADLPTVQINDRTFQVHDKHVQKIRDYHTMGFIVVVWSMSGHKWAESVVKALGLQDCVDFAMSKPHRIFDDVKDISTTLKHGYIPLKRNSDD